MPSNNKKIENILSLLEICESNIRNIKMLLTQSSTDLGKHNNIPSSQTHKDFTSPSMPLQTGYDDNTDDESTEGHFDGENMIGDNGQIYIIPQNYASKSQLVVGDKLKWALTRDAFGEAREVYKLVLPVLRDRVVGKFIIDNNNYAIIVEGYPNPIKILKASATYAIKNLDLKVGSEVAVFIPKHGNPTWGAFISVITTNSTKMPRAASDGRRIIYPESTSESTDNFDINKGYF